MHIVRKLGIIVVSAIATTCVIKGVLFPSLPNYDGFLWLAPLAVCIAGVLILIFGGE